jgi:cellulose synthase/poly-beta-1,6-N-acetylglucosamine synthase-like glycosyltransferase
MTIGIILFWIFILLIFYSYVGYGILLFFLNSFRSSKDKVRSDSSYQPEVTLFVPAFNEIDFLDKKVENSFELDYPENKLFHVWVTDGSDDGTPDALRKYDKIQVYHKDERSGKIAAMNRGMSFIQTPIVIFSDGNTILSKDAVKEIVKMFEDPKVGCVAGEKRIYTKDIDSAAGAGEGIYWRYESFLKRMDAELNSAVGAAGELFAIRTELFEEVEPDTLLDDFIISLRIAMKGYKIQYNPKAYAIESASASVEEELKRKIRIAAGSIQSVIRLSELLNIFKHKTLSFQYISHKVLRWIAVPLALVFLVPLNIMIVDYYNGFFVWSVYTFILWFQFIFYILVLVGWSLQKHKIKFKILFLPYYVFMMNLSMFLGFFRFLGGKQSVNWERAKRGELN